MTAGASKSSASTTCTQKRNSIPENFQNSIEIHLLLVSGQINDPPIESMRYTRSTAVANRQVPTPEPHFLEFDKLNERLLLTSPTLLVSVKEIIVVLDTPIDRHGLQGGPRVRLIIIPIHIYLYCTLFRRRRYDVVLMLCGARANAHMCHTGGAAEQPNTEQRYTIS